MNYHADGSISPEAVRLSECDFNSNLLVYCPIAYFYVILIY